MSSALVSAKAPWAAWVTDSDEQFIKPGNPHIQRVIDRIFASYHAVIRNDISDRSAVKRSDGAIPVPDTDSLLLWPKDWGYFAEPSRETVREALQFDSRSGEIWSINLRDASAIDLPTSVRPCCAFGNDQKVKVGAVQVPFYEQANTLDVHSLGIHAFDGGIAALQKNQLSGKHSFENNGIIYTRRGGFIDTAHVRDSADLTVALFFRIFPRLGESFTIELHPELGPRNIVFRETDLSHLNSRRRWLLAANLSARLAYQLAEAHEIAQWHGYRSFALWSEALSAYSPEDIYSNMVGARLAMALIVRNLAQNKTLFNQNMTLWFKAAIKELEPATKKQTQAMLDMVDSSWWQSDKPMPEKFMLLKRHYNLGSTQTPNLVLASEVKQHSRWHEVKDLYKEPTIPLIMSLPDSLYGFDLDQMAELQLHIDEKYYPSFTHIPGSLWKDQPVVPVNFALVAAYDKAEDDKELRNFAKGGE